MTEAAYPLAPTGESTSDAVHRADARAAHRGSCSRWAFSTSS